jgi:hypothetical protein
MNTTDTLRHATLDDMVTILRNQHARKIDLVMSASAMRFRDGRLVIRGQESVLEDDGVTDPNGTYTPTRTADTTLAARLDIPGRYLYRLRTERPDVYDFTLNRLLGGLTRRGADGTPEVVYLADDRNFLARLFRDDETQAGVLRAVLSDRYGIVDNLDVLMATLRGIQQAGVTAEVRDCDLTDARMNVKIYSPQVQALAPNLLAAYRNPFQANPEFARARGGEAEVEHWRRIAAREGQGYERGQEPVAFAGFRVTNSETGGGACTLTPEVWIKICKNGLTLPLLAERNVHLGARMEQGVWNPEVQAKALDLIVAQVKQRVTEWMSSEWLTAQVAEIESKAGKPVTTPAQTIKRLAKSLTWTQAEQEGILAHFTVGAQLTAGGVANAITSYSQTLGNADRAADLDDQAVKAMDLV